MKTVKTPNGTELPLVNLKGRSYLQVAHRIQWFNEACPRFSINTQTLEVTPDMSVVRAQVAVLSEAGDVLKSATATKREDSKGFKDHLEKAETGAVGRALAMLGYGTQFAMADLDEGERLADAPLVSPKKGNKSDF